MALAAGDYSQASTIYQQIISHDPVNAAAIGGLIRCHVVSGKLDEARARFDAGADSFLTVLDAERTLAQTDAALAQAEAQVADLQIQLFKALAGGWAPEDLPN